MKNIIKLLFLLFIISISSCQRCRYCGCQVEFINGAVSDWATNYVEQLGYGQHPLNAGMGVNGYDPWLSYLVETYDIDESGSKYVCGRNERKAQEDLAIENDLDGNGVTDYILTFDCSKQKGGGFSWPCFFC